MKICMLVYNFVNNGIGKIVTSYSAKLVEDGNRVTVAAGGPIESSVKEKAASLGIEVVQLPDKKDKCIAYLKALRKYLHREAFDIVHVHGNSGMVVPDLMAIKSCSYSKIVCHCHNTGCEHPVLHKILRPFASKLSDACFACSEEAGKWLFGCNGFVVLPNAFDCSRFAFSEIKRSEVRNKLGIPDDMFVMGNIARLNPEKNHAFLIEVFERFHRDNPCSCLLIAGGGPGEQRVKAIAESSSASSSIRLLGDVSDPSGLYCAMDCFVFPSLHEGLGIVLVEAQLAGLDCFVSSEVPDAACVSNGYHKLSLSDGADSWAHDISECVTIKELNERDPQFLPCAAAFDISEAYQALKSEYARLF